MRYERGYKSSSEVRSLLTDFLKNSYPVKMTIIALIYLVSIPFATGLGLWTLENLPPYAAIIINLTVIIFNARQMRALELLVHDGGHQNWIRKKK